MYVLICFSAQIGLTQKGLMAEYFDGTNFDRFVSAEYVDNIDDSWHDLPPVVGIDPHNCSIRWTGKLRPEKSGTYLFSAQVDDGIRVWIDDKLIINQWELNDVGVFVGKVELVSDTYYNLKVEYFNALLEGEIRLLWDIEKTKEEKSWYETIFGVEYNYSVITSDYYFKPDRPLTKTIVVENKSTFNKVVKKKQAKKAPSEVEKNVIVGQAKSKTKVRENIPVKLSKETSVKDVVQMPTQQVKQVVEIMTTELAEKYIPRDVQFERSKAIILASSTKELKIFTKFLQDNPKVEVTIEGHTENVGDVVENQELSERRAQKVASFFVDQGISTKRLKTVGYGGARPLKIPKKGEYCPQNRRVEFILRGLDL